MPTEGRAHPRLGDRLLALVLVASLAAADQWSKARADETLPARGGSVEVLPPVFSLTLSHNRGIFMGIGNRIGRVFTATSFAILAVLLWILWCKRLSRAWRASVAAIASGALGNGLDRLRFGYVRDFLDVHWHGWVYPTFNVADSCICVGAAVLALGLWREPSPS